MSTVIDPIAKPFATTEMSSARKGYQAARVQLARSELWPDGKVPAAVSERNRALCDWFGEKELVPPSERQLQRIFGGR
jgi:hypothetical protein